MKRPDLNQRYRNTVSCPSCSRNALTGAQHLITWMSAVEVSFVTLCLPPGKVMVELRFLTVRPLKIMYIENIFRVVKFL